MVRLKALLLLAAVLPGTALVTLKQEDEVQEETPVDHACRQELTGLLQQTPLDPTGVDVCEKQMLHTQALCTAFPCCKWISNIGQCLSAIGDNSCKAAAATATTTVYWPVVLDPDQVAQLTATTTAGVGGPAPPPAPAAPATPTTTTPPVKMAGDFCPCVCGTNIPWANRPMSLPYQGSPYANPHVANPAAVSTGYEAGFANASARLAYGTNLGGAQAAAMGANAGALAGPPVVGPASCQPGNPHCIRQCMCKCSELGKLAPNPAPAPAPAPLPLPAPAPLPRTCPCPYINCNVELPQSDDWSKLWEKIIVGAESAASRAMTNVMAPGPEARTAYKVASDANKMAAEALDRAHQADASVKNTQFKVQTLRQAVYDTASQRALDLAPVIVVPQAMIQSNASTANSTRKEEATERAGSRRLRAQHLSAN